MNHFRCVSDRISWCEIRRFKSSLSISNPKVRIPHRIKRDSTDILRALESTIPENVTLRNHLFRKDPYLSPWKIMHSRSWALSYESGRKAAIWIHNEHKDLFPKHLSEPPVNAFIPPAKYTNKSEVSEEMLLHAISSCKIDDALQIYNLLEDNISTETKQILLELLCFYQNEEKLLHKLHFEMIFSSSREIYVSKYWNVINKLYKFLICVDSPAVIAGAHNAMLCGLVKNSKIEEGWSLYKKCIDNNIPLNVITYNYILLLHKYMFMNKPNIALQNVYDTLLKMNKEAVKPNITTLNNTIQVLFALNKIDIGIIDDIVQHFQSIGVECSLTTYYFILFPIQKNVDFPGAYNEFLDILQQVENRQKFTVQNDTDYKFFSRAMSLAFEFDDKTSANQIHDLLLQQDKCILYQISETSYYNIYMSCILSTSNIQEFFNFYERFSLSVFIPSKELCSSIIQKCTSATVQELATCLPKFWSDINFLHNSNLALKISALHLFHKDMLSSESSLKATFTNIVQDCWNIIKIRKMNEFKNQENLCIEAHTLFSMAIIFLHEDNVNEFIEVLTYIIRESHNVIGILSDTQQTELYEYCISKQYFIGALLVLQYSINLGFEHIVQKATELYNHPQLTNADRDKLISLVGMKRLHTSKLN